MSAPGMVDTRSGEIIQIPALPAYNGFPLGAELNGQGISHPVAPARGFSGHTPNVPLFELETELAKEINRPFEVIDADSYVAIRFERHMSNLQGVV